MTKRLCLARDGYNEELTCSLCLDSWCHPVELVPCGHIFCGECAIQDLSAFKQCPVCRADVEGSQAPHRSLVNMALKVDVQCTHCRWTGTREASYKHSCSGAFENATTSEGAERQQRPARPGSPSRSEGTVVERLSTQSDPNPFEYDLGLPGHSLLAPMQPVASVHVPRPVTLPPLSRAAGPGCGAAPPARMAASAQAGPPRPRTSRIGPGNETDGLDPADLNAFAEIDDSFWPFGATATPPPQASGAAQNASNTNPLSPSRTEAKSGGSGRHSEESGVTASSGNDTTAAPSRPEQTHSFGSFDLGSINSAAGFTFAGDGAAAPPTGPVAYSRAGSELGLFMEMGFTDIDMGVVGLYPGYQERRPVLTARRSGVIHATGPTPWRHYKMTEEEYKEVRSMFDCVDQDRDGFLDVTQTVRLTRWLNVAQTVGQVTSMIEEFETKREGMVSCEELLTWMCTHSVDPQKRYRMSAREYKAALAQFHKFDKDQDGWLRCKEFVAFCKARREFKSTLDAQVAFAKMDRLGQKKIDLDTFLTYRARQKAGKRTHLPRMDEYGFAASATGTTAMSTSRKTFSSDNTGLDSFGSDFHVSLSDEDDYEGVASEPRRFLAPGRGTSTTPSRARRPLPLSSTETQSSRPAVGQYPTGGFSVIKHDDSTDYEESSVPESSLASRNSASGQGSQGHSTPQRLLSAVRARRAHSQQRRKPAVPEQDVQKFMYHPQPPSSAPRGSRFRQRR